MLGLGRIGSMRPFGRLRQVAVVARALGANNSFVFLVGPLEACTLHGNNFGHVDLCQHGTRLAPSMALALVGLSRAESRRIESGEDEGEGEGNTPLKPVVGKGAVCQLSRGSALPGERHLAFLLVEKYEQARQQLAVSGESQLAREPTCILSL